jgi:hypothetical protein
MRSLIASAGIVAVGLLAGCSSQRKAPYANDPVLLHYKPTLNDSATIMAEKQAHHGPTKPPMPAGSRDAAADSSTVAKTPTDSNVQPAKAEVPPGQLLPPPPGQGPQLAQSPAPTTTPNSSSLPVRPQEPGALPAPTVPAAIPDSVAMNGSQPAADAAATATEVRSADGIYAHHKDYHRIQGVLERHYRGYYSVRYCDPSEEDQYGGKFRLVDDQRIGQFSEGDVIAVEGEMIANGPEEYNLNPRFKIHTVRLVRQK